MAILMADVAGYSRLIAADDEGTFAQLNAHHAELIQPKISQHRGRIARTTGDGLLVLFASVVDALRCAVEIQRAMADRNCEVPPEKRLEFRMGINVGDIIEAASIHGDGVNVAARLEALAEVGGICVSDRVQEDVHGSVDRLGIAFEDAGQHQLKNIARPVRVYRVRLNRTAKAQEAAPSRGSSPGPATAERLRTGAGEPGVVAPAAADGAIPPRGAVRWRVGRTAALATLDGMTQRMLAGARQLVFITGEPGIGKTTFIAMAIERLSRHGVGALYGHCMERFGTDEAFHPLIDALETRCRGPGGSSVLAAIRARAPTWLLQMPSFREETDAAAFQNEVFGATRERMLREFCDLMEVLSVDRPLVLVLEDLHWSDLPTLDVLSRLARGDRRASVLVLATYRPVDTMIGGHPVRRLHQDLAIHGRCSELRLDPLSRAEVEHHLALRFGNADLVATLSGPLFGRTQGQPLFLASLLDYFINQQVVFEADGAWRLGSEAAISQNVVPSDLINMITHQMDRLTEDERQLLEVASVAGGEFAAALVAAGLSRDTVETEEMLDALARKDRTLVASRPAEWPDGTYSGSYAFQHILYQNVLYQGLTPGRRAQIHRRMGERLREGYGNRSVDIAPTLALHSEHGRDFPNALRHLSQAAESSAKRLGHEEAANYLTRALGILDHLKPEDQYGPRIGLLRQRSWARRSSGDLAGSVQDLKEMIAGAAAAGQLRAEVNGLLAVSRFCLHADRRLCLQASEEAAAKAHAIEDEVFRALVLGSSASINLYLKGWREEDAALCLKAMQVTAGAKDHATLIRRDGIEGILECSRSRYQECRISATHGKKLSREVGDIYIFVLFNVMEATALLHLGEWRQLQQETVEALALAEKNANRPARALCRLTLAWLYVEAMDFAGARDLCEDVDEAILDENPFAFFVHHAVLAKAFVGLGEPQRAAKQFEDVQRRVDADGTGLDFTIYTQFYHCFGEYGLLVGDIALARSSATHLRNYTAPAPDRNHLALAYGLLARIAFAAGDLEEARGQLARALETLDNQNLPLAAWRIYLAAAEIFQGLGEPDKAAQYRDQFENVVRALAQNFEAEDRLRASLLAALAPNRFGRSALPAGRGSPR